MAHALFPYEPDPDEPDAPEEDPRDIALIQVARHEPGNRVVFVPQTYNAADLPDLATIAAKWGGGSYVLTARNTQNSKISAKAYVNLPGPSKPLVDETPPAAASAAPAAAVPPGLGAIVAQILPLSPVILAAFEYFKTKGDAQASTYRAMVEMARADARAMAETAAKSAEATQATMAQFFEKVTQLAVQGSGGGTSGGEGFVKAFEMGMDLMKATQNAALANAQGDPDLSSLGALAQGFGAAVQAQAQADIAKAQAQAAQAQALRERAEHVERRNRALAQANANAEAEERERAEEAEMRRLAARAIETAQAQHPEPEAPEAEPAPEAPPELNADEPAA